jgi:hypothetical protein
VIGYPLSDGALPRRWIIAAIAVELDADVPPTEQATVMLDGRRLHRPVYPSIRDTIEARTHWILDQALPEGRWRWRFLTVPVWAATPDTPAEVVVFTV